MPWRFRWMLLIIFFDWYSLTFQVFPLLLLLVINLGLELWLWIQIGWRDLWHLFATWVLNDDNIRWWLNLVFHDFTVYVLIVACVVDWWIPLAGCEELRSCWVCVAMAMSFFRLWVITLPDEVFCWRSLFPVSRLSHLVDVYFHFNAATQCGLVRFTFVQIFLDVVHCLVLQWNYRGKNAEVRLRIFLHIHDIWICFVISVVRLALSNFTPLWHVCPDETWVYHEWR